MKIIEFKVKPITRYIITRYTANDEDFGGKVAGCESVGFFENERDADEVMDALAHKDRELNPDYTVTTEKALGELQ